ncbi:MAG TPA: hypothetical protein VMV72_02040 [Verrucomicrobiae bacterium]|nr:hypothetical protein [Verrucomicrobiae bacterium]
MHGMRHVYLFVGLVLSITFISDRSNAQYTVNYQTNIISGVVSNWTGDYHVGGIRDVLLIRDRGVLGDNCGDVGINYGTSNNTVLVSDPGAVWSNSCLTIGEEGRGNSLVVSNGGQVISTGSGIGSDFGSNNTVLVTGAGSVWSNTASVSVGYYGRNNRLVISDGGQVLGGSWAVSAMASGNAVVVSGAGSVFSNTFISGNLIVSNGSQVISGRGTLFWAQVSDPGSVWSVSGTLVFPYYGAMVISNGGLVVDGSAYLGQYITDSNNTIRVVNGGTWQNGDLYVGHDGVSNSVTVSGGSVSATNVILGGASTMCNNVLELDSGTITVTNNSGTGVLDISRGTLIVNSGVLRADTLVITNPCAQFIHTGGTLIVSNMVVDPNLFRITSITRQSNDMLVTWMMGPGASNTLQVATVGADGSYNANGFSDIFVITNNPSLGTIANYLDVGAATNGVARYYRARLIP